MNIHPSPAAILRIIRAELETYIAPAVAGERGQLGITLITMLLSALEARLGKGAEAETSHGRWLMHVVTDLLASLEAVPQGAYATRVREQIALVKDAVNPEASMKHLNEAVESLLAPGALGAASEIDTFRIQLADKEELRRETLRHILLEADGPTGPPFSPQPPFTCEELTPLLRRRFPDHPNMQAVSAVEIGGGFSKRTFRLRTEFGPAELQDCVARQDMVSGAINSTVANEVSVIEAARAAGVLAPKVYLSEPQSHSNPAGFIILEHIAGRCDIGEWSVKTPGKDPPGALLAQQLALLHSMPVERISPDAARQSVTDAILHHIEDHEERWVSQRFQAEPLVRMAFDWLKANVPRDIEHLSIVHADISERNILVKDGRMTALLDWELWHIGDANEDLAYARTFIERIMDWKSFLDIYRAHGGPAYRESYGLFWAVWAPLRILTYQTVGINAFERGANKATKMITPLVYYNPLFLAQLATALKAVMPPRGL